MAKKKSRFREMATDDDLTKRTEQSYNNRESSGKYNDYFTDDMPLQKWYCGEGDHSVDVIPWIATAAHPNVKENKPTHNIDIFVHFGIGVTESAYICPARMGIGKCPICEFQAELKKRKDYDEDYVKSFNAKRRVVYNVLVYDTPKDEDAGMMLWEASHHLSEKNIMAIARNKRSGGFVKWTSPDVGKTVDFTREGKGKGTKYIGFTFVDREDAQGNQVVITDDILDETIEIEKYLDIKTYDELVEILGDVDVPENEPLPEEESYEEAVERTPRRGSRRGTQNVDEEKQEEKQEEKTEVEEKPQRRSRRTRTKEPEEKEKQEEETETGTTLKRRGRRRR